ncbi:TetR/AcrR family transcriptional regulator [Cellulomonas sp. P4]|uniref:TetR/AcrR family transcriptional regulator n=1 Tax=Cellulomonas sp. P4 TaxID=3142533 RepID=UPI0031BB470B
MTPGPARRRRGQALEDAILEAAWDEVVEAGFANLTMESVAARARTGVAVLYRRWANKVELVLAATEHNRRAHPVELPDTGTLRGDLLALLGGMGRARSSIFPVGAAIATSGLLAGSDMTPRQMRASILGDQALSDHARTVYQRAHDRGEIDLRRIPLAVLTLPSDLVRHDIFMDLGPVGPERLRAIVDDVFLPLARSYSQGQGAGDADTGGR